jgi:hypothetical protein
LGYAVQDKLTTGGPPPNFVDIEKGRHCEGCVHVGMLEKGGSRANHATELRERVLRASNAPAEHGAEKVTKGGPTEKIQGRPEHKQAIFHAPFIVVFEPCKTVKFHLARCGKQFKCCNSEEIAENKMEEGGIDSAGRMLARSNVMVTRLKPSFNIFRRRKI